MTAVGWDLLRLGTTIYAITTSFLWTDTVRCYCCLQEFKSSLLHRKRRDNFFYISITRGRGWLTHSKAQCYCVIHSRSRDMCCFYDPSRKSVVGPNIHDQDLSKGIGPLDIFTPCSFPLINKWHNNSPPTSLSQLLLSTLISL